MDAPITTVLLLLLMRYALPHFVGNARAEEILRRYSARHLAEFLKSLIERFCSAIGIGAGNPSHWARALRGFLFGAGALLPLGELAAGEIDLPPTDPRDNIYFRASSAEKWREGAYDVWRLQGDCHVRQGQLNGYGDEAIVWVDRGSGRPGDATKVIVYLEGKVEVTRAEYNQNEGKTVLKDKSWIGRLHTIEDVDFDVPPEAITESGDHPTIFRRAIAARSGPTKAADAKTPGQTAGYKHTKQQGGAPSERGPIETEPALEVGSASGRRLLIAPRGTVRSQLEVIQSPDGSESVAVITNGVRIAVEGIGAIGELGGFDPGRIELETDRAVVWTSSANQLFAMGDNVIDENTPLEFFLDGNIIFRQGDRVIYAKRMYYNVTTKQGVILAAEMLTPVPEYQGLLRLKADVIQQVGEQNFEVYGGAFTSSRLGVPRYWLQSERFSVTDNPRPLVDSATGQVLVDPQTGEQEVDHVMTARAKNNFVYAGGVPVFYWPFIGTNLETPSYYIRKATVRSDRVFGTQVYVDLDLYQLLGFADPPDGTQWSLSTDLLSKRGAALGTDFRYQREDFLGIPGHVGGIFDAWGLRDEGLDNLGFERRDLLPESDFRGRVFANHRQELGDGLQFTGELGFISDRNFLEQYFEKDWDTQKDELTSLELKKYYDNQTIGVIGSVRLNDFFMQTEWLPKVDHYLIGQPLFTDRINWTAHTNVGYANLKTASEPLNPVEQAVFDPLPYEVPSEGLRAATRHELNFPIDLGPVRVAPYLLGEAAHWGEDLNGDDMDRLYGQAGVRMSLPFTSVDPEARSQLFNVNGLAHTIMFNADAFYADANEDLTDLPLYDQIDDDAQEHFRRRLKFQTFGLPAGTPVPARFDERFFAVRSNLQGNVTSPSTEIAEDLQMVRLGVNQRWQTKRGLPGRERIIDWITLDAGISYFPEPDRDNFGEDVGMATYDFRWHVGDRVTLLSDGFADVFSDGLKTVSIGGLITRPENGEFYLGYRQIEGPISSQIVTAAVGYRLTEKWAAHASTAIDFGETGNIGQNFVLTRVGESLLMSIGMNVDSSRNNVGFTFNLEPRFLPRSRYSRIGGVPIAPAGMNGLE